MFIVKGVARIMNKSWVHVRTDTSAGTGTWNLAQVPNSSSSGTLLSLY